MIWSKYCIDSSLGFDIIYGVQVPRKLGCFVSTIEECDAALALRRLPGGDLSKEYIDKEFKEFVERLNNR